MPEFPKLPIISPPPTQSPKFPDLPILEPDPPRMTLREKFGGLYYLAIGGLIVSMLLVGTFFYQFYRTRDLWAAVYVLYDETASLPARNHAAWMIAHNPDANDRQKMTFALQTTLPELTRYIVAEGLSPEAIQADPKAYALMAARSEPWARLAPPDDCATDGLRRGGRLPDCLGTARRTSRTVRQGDGPLDDLHSCSDGIRRTPRSPSNFATPPRSPGRISRWQPYSARPRRRKERNGWPSSTRQPLGSASTTRPARRFGKAGRWSMVNSSSIRMASRHR